MRYRRKLCPSCGEKEIDIDSKTCRPCWIQTMHLNPKPKFTAYKKEHFKNDEDFEMFKERHKKNRRKSVLKQKFKITLEQYEQMLAEQNYKCAICEISQEEYGKNFSVDHNRKCCSGSISCGKCVRGLLCNICNLVIGNMNDEGDILMKAVEYLNKNKGRI